MNGLPPIVKERPPEGTRRVLLTVSYDGTAYAGWQWQDNALSVQQVLEEALARLTGTKDARDWRQPYRCRSTRPGPACPF